MKNILYILPLSMFLFSNVMNAQSFYMEKGFNSISTLNYSNTEAVFENSETVMMPQISSEIGLRYPYSEKVILSMGLTNNAFSYANEIHFPLDASADEILEVNSSFDLAYMGANLGFDYAIIENTDWTLFFSGKISGNILTSGSRTDEVTNADPSIFASSNTDLMHDSSFNKRWFNLHYGLAFSYQLSDLASVCSRYTINNTLRKSKTDTEKYSFNSHTFSVGLILHLGKQDYLKKQNRIKQ